ncbi:MAG: HAD family hydrolase [Desulfobacterales bacterium]|nr:HAD family hydrolase [Desulfobacterales bacterium]
MRDIKVVAFDCDGVLFDSVKANSYYYNNILAHFDRPAMTPEQFTYTHMHTVKESLAYLFEDRRKIEAANDYCKKISYIPFIKYMKIEPYLRPLLQRLRPKYKTAIATNRTDTMNYVLIEHDLEGCFDIVVSALDVEHPKPHPDQLIKILNHFNIEPNEAIYVGDSQLDEIAAKAAGISLVAYKNNSLSADHHIESLKELEAILF